MQNVCTVYGGGQHSYKKMAASDDDQKDAFLIHMLPTHVWWWSFFSGIQDMCQHTAGQHMSDDDHFSEGQTVTHGSRWSFFAKRTQNLLMYPQNGNLRFLTHNRDLGAIPPPKWSYGRRASFWFDENHQKWYGFSENWFYRAPNHLKMGKMDIFFFKISKVLRMGFSIVENLSGLCGNISSLFRRSQLHFNWKKTNVDLY